MSLQAEDRKQYDRLPGSDWQSFVSHLQALVSPFTGILGDKFNRIILVAVGTFLWGIMTAAIGLSTTLSQVWWAF